MQIEDIQRTPAPYVDEDRRRFVLSNLSTSEPYGSRKVQCKTCESRLQPLVKFSSQTECQE